MVSWIIALLFVACSELHRAEKGLSVTNLAPNESYDVTWYAPFYSGGGYSSEAMAFLASIDSVTESDDIAIAHYFTVQHHGDSFNQAHVDGLTLLEKDLLMRYSRKAHRGSKLAISICHSEPGAWHAPYPKYNTSPCPPEENRRKSQTIVERTTRRYNIGRTMFETDRVPVGWLPRLDFMDEIWVPTTFSKEVFVRSGVNASKLFVVPEPVNTDFYRPKHLSSLSRETITSYHLEPLLSIPADCTVFLFVGKFEARKGITLLLNSYFDAFLNDEKVMLLILTSSYHSDSDFEKTIMDSVVNGRRLAIDGSFSATPPYRILTGIAQEGMPYLYSAVNALVIPSHGEGWGRPHMEAMACGTPVVATNWSGPTAFITREVGYLIDIEKELVPAPGWTGHLWAQPVSSHLTALLEHIHRHKDEARQLGMRARDSMLAQFRLQIMGGVVSGHIQRIMNSL